MDKHNWSNKFCTNKSFVVVSFLEQEEDAETSFGRIINKKVFFSRRCRNCNSKLVDFFNYLCRKDVATWWPSSFSSLSSYYSCVTVCLGQTKNQISQSQIRGQFGRSQFNNVIFSLLLNRHNLNWFVAGNIINKTRFLMATAAATRCLTFSQNLSPFVAVQEIVFVQSKSDSFVNLHFCRSN